MDEPLLVVAGPYLRDRVGLDAEEWVPQIEPTVDADHGCQAVHPQASLWSRWWLELLEKGEVVQASPLGGLRASSSAWATVCDRLGEEPVRAVSGYRHVGARTPSHELRLEWEILNRYRLPDDAVPGRDQLRLVVLPVRGLRARRGNVLVTGTTDRRDTTQHLPWLERELADHEQRLHQR